MDELDLRGGLIIVEQDAVIPPHPGGLSVPANPRRSRLFRRLSRDHRTAVLGRDPVEVLRRAVGTPEVSCLGCHGLEIWSEGSLRVEPEATRTAAWRLAKFVTQVRQRYGGELSGCGASISTSPRCLAIEWRVAGLRACTNIAAPIGVEARARNLVPVETDYSIDVLAMEPTFALGTAPITRLVRSLNAPAEGRLQPVRALLYVHTHHDDDEKRLMLARLMDSEGLPPAASVRVAPAYEGAPPSRPLVVRGAAGVVEIPRPLDGIRGVVEALGALAGS